MTDLVVRRLLVDLKTPIPRRWNGGDAFRSAFFNALSMSFPAGEQVFIDSVRMGLARLHGPAHERFEAEARGFIGQEATHRRVHELFNAHLAAAGLVNHWEPRIHRRLARLRRLAGNEPRAWLGISAATEHLTALLAEHLLSHPQMLEGAEPRLRNLWLWHSAEESEHRCTAFDLYRALGGNEKWRLRLYGLVCRHFATDLLRQTLHNLWRDGALWKASTWRSAWATLLGPGGILRVQTRGWRRYFDPGFHPLEGDGRPGQRWLADHAWLAPAVADIPPEGAGRVR